MKIGIDEQIAIGSFAQSLIAGDFGTDDSRGRCLRFVVVRSDWMQLPAICAAVLFAALILPGIPRIHAQTSATTDKSASAAEKTSETAAESNVIVRGRVVDGVGNPIADARVTTYPRVSDDSGFTTQTNVRGVFSFTLPLLPGTLRNRQSADRVMGAIFKPGFAIGAFDSIKTPIRVVLQNADRIVFELQSPEGKPVENADVTPGTLHFVDKFLSRPPPDSWRAHLVSTTNQEGRASMETVARKELRSVIVISANWARQSLVVPRTETADPIMLQLQPVGIVGGQLLDPRGEPIVGQELYALSTIISDSAQYDTTTTLAAGRFQFRLPVGRYNLAAVHDNDDTGFQPVTVTVRKDMTETVEIRTQPLRRVVGRVVTEQGTSAANLPVTFSSQLSRKFVVTDGDGQFETKLHSDSWQYACGIDEVPGYLPRQGNEGLFYVQVKNTDVELPDITVATGKIINGQVHGIDASESRIRVVIINHNGKRYASQYDAEGRFQLTIPHDVDIEQLQDFEIRFVDDPITVTSTEPLILEVSTSKEADSADQR